MKSLNLAHDATLIIHGFCGHSLLLELNSLSYFVNPRFAILLSGYWHGVDSIYIGKYTETNVVQGASDHFTTNMAIYATHPGSP